MAANVVVGDLPAGLQKVQIEHDTKIPNAATITVRQDDHTLGNLLKSQLLKDKHVVFAGYKMWHPLEHSFLLNIQTDGSKTPEQAVSDAINVLVKDINDISSKFQNEFAMFDH